MFSYLSEYSMEAINNKVFTDIAYDGFQTYILAEKNQIFVLDSNFACVKKINTCYDTMCYDSGQDCFWAASGDFPGIIFQLSSALEEKNRITLQFTESKLQNIRCLCCDMAAPYLYFVENNAIYRTDHSGNVRLVAGSFIFKEPLQDISVINGNIFCLVKGQKNYSLFLLPPNGKMMLADQAFPGGWEILSTLLYKSAQTQEIMLRILAVKPEGNVYVMDYSPDSQLRKTYQFLMENGKEQPADSYNLNMQQLSRCRNGCPDWVAAYNRSFCSQSSFCRPNGGGLTPGMCGPQNSEQNACTDFCADGQVNCHCHPCIYQSCSDVIESIALTEASIAHIINAEGEKLQKAIACSNNVSELLKVNESVLKTIIQSTHLEQVLYDKLYAVLNSCICSCETDCAFCRCQSVEPPDMESE